MNSCHPVAKEVLDQPIHIQTEEKDLDFNKARQLADQEARKHSPDPMMLAWFDKKAGRFSPPVECCGDEKPSWLIYAESRGGNITIDINQEEFVFVYLGS